MMIGGSMQHSVVGIGNGLETIADRPFRTGPSDSAGITEPSGDRW